jgi:4-amino-4-deoxy-L-arabinose transferase-like glycosyltransferase
MVHWPKTARGYVLAVSLLVVGLPISLILVVALSGPLVWGGIALIAVTCVVMYIWRRRRDNARERAWVGSFSFGDVVARMHAREALDHAAPPRTADRTSETPIS